MMPLEYGREVADLILFFKLQTGIIDLDFRKYCTKVVDHGHRTRNFDTKNFNVKIIKKDYLKHSFFNRVISLWNKLPRSLKSIDTLMTFIVRNLNWSIHGQSKYYLIVIPEPTARSAVPGVSPGRGLLIPHGYLHPGKCEHSEVQSSSIIGWRAHHFGSWVDLIDLKNMVDRQERKRQRFTKNT